MLRFLSFIDLWPFKAATEAATTEPRQAEQRPSERALALTYAHPVSWSSWRQLGKQLVDMVADYYAGVERLPVMSATRPGFLRSVLAAEAPEQGEDLAVVLQDVRSHIIPGLTHWQHPRFFSYFPCNVSIPAMLAEILASGVGVLGFQWIASPACTELEQLTLDWLAKLLGLPPCFLSTAPRAGSVLQGSASEAVLVALLAARARAMQGRQAEEALKLVAYASDQSHSCVQKACMVAGIQHVRLLVTGAAHNYGLQPAVLEAAVQADLAAGLLPCFLCATIGTTSSCAVDPLAELAFVARHYGIWVNVDAAWAGVFALLPDQRERLFGGLELADSYDMNPHKALLTGWECSAMWVQDAQWVKKALTVTPPYLVHDDTGMHNGSSSSHAAGSNSGSSSSGEASSSLANGSSIDSSINTDGGSGSSGRADGDGDGGGAMLGTASTACTAYPPEYKDLDVPLGHGRFRALRLWFVLRLYGAEGLRRLMDHRLQLMDFFADMVQEDPRFQLVPGAPPRFGLVCFRLRGSDELNMALLEAVNASGVAFLSHTILGGQYVIRCAIGGTWTQGTHVEQAWHAVQACASALLAEATTESAQAAAASA